MPKSFILSQLWIGNENHRSILTQQNPPPKSVPISSSDGYATPRVIES